VSPLLHSAASPRCLSFRSQSEHQSSPPSLQKQGAANHPDLNLFDGMPDSHHHVGRSHGWLEDLSCSSRLRLLPHSWTVGLVWHDRADQLRWLSLLHLRRRVPLHRQQYRQPQAGRRTGSRGRRQQNDKPLHQAEVSAKLLPLLGQTVVHPSPTTCSTECRNTPSSP
jgi:hypothetical protein